MLGRKATRQLAPIMLLISAAVCTFVGATRGENIYREAQVSQTTDQPLVIIAPAAVVVACTEGTDPSVTGMPKIQGGVRPYSTRYADEAQIRIGDQRYGIQRTWIAIDAVGNRSKALQTIVVEDTIPPVITCPPNLYTSCENPGNLGEPEVYEDCDPSPSLVLEERYAFYRCPWAR